MRLRIGKKAEAGSGLVKKSEKKSAWLSVERTSHFRCFRPPGPRPRNAIRLSDELRPGRARCALSQVTCNQGPCSAYALGTTRAGRCRDAEGGSPECHSGTMRAVFVLAGAHTSSHTSSADSRALPTTSRREDAGQCGQC